MSGDDDLPPVDPKNAYLPTPAEIEAAAAEIRKGWSRGQERERRVSGRVDWLLPRPPVDETRLG